jgi:hypothetical protein
MADKVLSAGFETEFGIDILHRSFVEVEAYKRKSVCVCVSMGRLTRVRAIRSTLVGCRVGIRPALDPFEELLETSLFKDAHERAPESLRLVAGDL